MCRICAASVGKAFDNVLERLRGKMRVDHGHGGGGVTEELADNKQ